jgi:hypothetical protein
VNRSNSQRDLRRTVAALLERPIDDIESIWNTLSASEREQLRPVIADAAGLNAKASILLASDRQSANSPAETNQRETAGRLAYLIESLPDTLGARLYAGVDNSMQVQINALLTEGRRNLVQQHENADSVTSYARAAWLDACLRHAGDVPISPRIVNGPHNTRPLKRIAQRLCHLMHQWKRTWLC